MKGTLEFDLNDRDDRMSHMRCLKSTDMALVLWEIRNNLRKRCETILENQEETPDGFRGVEIVFEAIYELMYSHDVNVDHLIE